MRTAADRFWPKVDASGDCWEWTGGRARGYGTFWVDGRLQPAHRIAYELLVGPIPLTLQIDHLCRNRGCVNPTHLEPVTLRENLRRIPTRRPARVCKRGHPFTAETSLRTTTGKTCRICDRARQRRKYAERQAAFR